MQRLALLIAILLLLGCADSVTPPPPDFTPTIAPSPLPVGLTASAADLAALISYQSDTAIPQFSTTSTATLFADLTNKTFDQIIVHHIPEQHSDLWFNPIALDGLVAIVHADNPVQNLSLGELQAVFSGNISNWMALGGSDAPIKLLSRENGSGVRSIFNQRVLGAQRLDINAAILASPVAIRQAIAADPHAIGYVTLGSLPRATTDATLAVRQLAINGVQANPATTAEQSYPLTMPLYWVSAVEPTSHSRALLGWLQSDDGQVELGVRFGRIIR